jgi:uncharacterized protein YjbI with pentapeptide repeats
MPSVASRAARLAAALPGAETSGSCLARAMHIHFEEVLLVSAKLPAFSFRKETLQKVDMSGADLRKCDFRATGLGPLDLAHNASIGGFMNRSRNERLPPRSADQRGCAWWEQQGCCSRPKRPPT